MEQQRIGVRCIHKLKTWPQFFDAVACGVKGFELRKDDRGFKVGDVLLLQEFDPYKGEGSYSGREVSRLVLYKLDAASFSGIEKDYCIMGLGVLPQYAAKEICMEHYGNNGKLNCAADCSESAPSASTITATAPIECVHGEFLDGLCNACTDNFGKEFRLIRTV